MAYIAYGPNENCTLAVCPVAASVYEYRPSIAANSCFIALFSISMVIHIIQALKWRTWFYLGAIVSGCITEVVGYGGRLILWKDPFSFPGFLMQISEFMFPQARSQFLGSDSS